MARFAVPRHEGHCGAAWRSQSTYLRKQITESCNSIKTVLPHNNLALNHSHATTHAASQAFANALHVAQRSTSALYFQKISPPVTCEGLVELRLLLPMGP
jgi:hypothetical protein